jgi:hypothetical protein
MSEPRGRACLCNSASPHDYLVPVIEGENEKRSAGWSKHEEVRDLYSSVDPAKGSQEWPNDWETGFLQRYAG